MHLRNFGEEFFLLFFLVLALSLEVGTELLLECFYVGFGIIFNFKLLFCLDISNMVLLAGTDTRFQNWVGKHWKNLQHIKGNIDFVNRSCKYTT